MSQEDPKKIQDNTEFAAALCREIGRIEKTPEEQERRRRLREDDKEGEFILGLILGGLLF